MPNKPHDSGAEVYDEAYTQSFGSLYAMLTRTSLEIIQEKTKLDADILDIGAGTGRLSIPLMHHGYSLYAVDASAKMLDVLKRKDVERVIQTIHCPLQELELNRKFDAVLCVFSVFCYLISQQDLRAAIQSIARHTSNRGYALIDVPFSSSFSGLSYESETLSRQIEVKNVDPEMEIFEYSENVKITDNERQFIYEDNFQIRCWDVKVILVEFKNAGMSVREDISERFEGSGAHYFILDKI